jgi:osmoprotectant transport system substrate-binding protein
MTMNPQNHSSHSRARRGVALAAGLAASALVLAGCSNSDPLAEESPAMSDDVMAQSIVIGSQSYYSNEIIAEIYAQALENAGYTVERQFNIGQRDAYIPSLESGAIDLFPEYSGNLLQYFDPETTARTTEDVYAALPEALPEGLAVLDQSSATDQDSYTVTAAFAAQYELESIADLANVDVPLVLGGPPELADRPYGPNGVAEVYGVEVGFEPTGDTTVEDLVAGTVNVANVYTADPRIQTSDLVVLADPEGLFLASNVVPVVSADIADEVAAVIDAVSAALTPEGLVALNVRSTVDQASPADIAREWLEENGLV